MAVVLPDKPASDLIELLGMYGVAVIWRNTGNTFTTAVCGHNDQDGSGPEVTAVPVPVSDVETVLAIAIDLAGDRPASAPVSDIDVRFGDPGLDEWIPEI